MRIYNYIAFSIYYIFKKTIKRDDHIALVFKTSTALTLICLSVFYSLFFFGELKGYYNISIPTIYLFAIMVMIWLPNYLYLKKEEFLNSDFSFSFRNIFSTIAVVFLFGGTFYWVASQNRERLFKELGYSQEIIDNGGVESFDPNKKPESLEGDIRLWYYNTFEKKDTLNK